MSIVSFRVDEETKKKMESIKDFNWSEILRQFLVQRINEEQNRRKINFKLRQHAFDALDEIYSKEEEVSIEDWDSTKELQKWRTKRK